MVTMNYFGALHKYGLEILIHRRDLYQTSAFYGHVSQWNSCWKITLGHMTKNKCGYQMYIFVTPRSQCSMPVWWCFCMVQPPRQPFRPKCTNRVLQMHQQNPVVPPESTDSWLSWGTSHCLKRFVLDFQCTANWCTLNRHGPIISIKHARAYTTTWRQPMLNGQQTGHQVIAANVSLICRET